MNWHTCMTLESLWIDMRGQPMLNWHVSCLLKHDKLLLLWFIIGHAFFLTHITCMLYMWSHILIWTASTIHCMIFPAYLGFCTVSHAKSCEGILALSQNEELSRSNLLRVVRDGIYAVEIGKNFESHLS